MDKFDEHEVCPACGNDPVESGLKWKPKFRESREAQNKFSEWVSIGCEPYLEVSCGQCRYKMKRGCLGNV